MKPRGDLLSSAGSILAAAASSACCWLPLLFVAAGFSAAGAASFFASYRPVFLVAAVALLAVGFYLNYRRRPHAQCAPGESCAPGDARLHRLSRGMLWVSTAFVLAFAFFPSYVGHLFGVQDLSAAAANETIVLSVQGMTCGGCEAAVQTSLLEVPGVLAAEASYDNAEAVLTVDASAPPPRMALAAAVAKAGYELTGTSGEPAPDPIAGQWRTDLPTEDGTTELIVHLGQLDSRWVGELDLPAYEVEDYPVVVDLEGSTVTLHFTAIGLDFEGAVTEDGSTLSGTARGREGENEPIVFQRIGAAEFSPTFLELEAAADDPSLIQHLSLDGAELRRRFNEDSDQVRLLMLLAPS